MEHGEFGPDTKFKDWMVDLLCHDISPYICSNMMFLLFGFDQAQMNMTLIDKINHHSPSGTSVKNMCSMSRRCLLVTIVFCIFLQVRSMAHYFQVRRIF